MSSRSEDEVYDAIEAGEALDEAACLDAIDRAGCDAYGMITQANKNFERRFKRIDKALIDLLADVRKHFPDAEYYTASGGFNLLLGKPHATNRQQTSQGQLSALHGRAEIGDGDY